MDTQHTENHGDFPLFRPLDRLVALIGDASAWIYFLIGVIVTYEVVMRYFFNAPTYWVEEVSRLGMVWATFLIFASCLAHRHMITITLVKGNLPEGGRAMLELVTFVGMAVLSAVLLRYGVELMLDAIRVGRGTATPLRVPYWIFYLPLCAGFALLLLQSVAEAIFILVTRRRRLPDAETDV